MLYLLLILFTFALFVLLYEYSFFSLRNRAKKQTTFQKGDDKKRDVITHISYFMPIILLVFCCIQIMHILLSLTILSDISTYSWNVLLNDFRIITHHCHMS